jgi:hypothetical protein
MVGFHKSFLYISQANNLRPTYRVPITFDHNCPAMKWKQFFTPASNITGDEAKKLVAGKKPAEVVYLDVRQPKEYITSHIPGSKLIPIGELDKHLNELDPDIPTIVY